MTRDCQPSMSIAILNEITNYMRSHPVQNFPIGIDTNVIDNKQITLNT